MYQLDVLLLVNILSFVKANEINKEFAYTLQGP